MNPQFWQAKKVLLTGHTGFKGSWLAVWLERLGAHVIGYSLLPPTDPSMFAAARVADGVKSIEGDVRDLERLAAIMSQDAPEIVIHMAAQALVKTAYSDPVTTYTTNVIGTLNVLEAVRKAPSVRVVVSITSDKCYENVEWVWGYRENDRMGGHDPYSSSKACAELLIAAYRDSYFPLDRISEHGVRLASTRAGNVIGGGDWSNDRLVPDIMKAIIAGQPVLIRSPHAIRPWQFVLEPLRGYLDLTERLWSDGAAFAGAWNFGPDIEQTKTVQWIVEHLTNLWGKNATWELDRAIHPHETHCLKLDCTKAKSLLGWRPALDLRTGLDWIVEWYRAFQVGDDVRVITEAQIDRYKAIINA
jgi:CDP-glucose 4,6-dehydratase